MLPRARIAAAAPLMTNSERRHHHHRHAGDRLRREQALERRPGDGAGHHQKDRGVDQRRHDRGRAEAVGVALGRMFLRDGVAAPGQDQRQHVAGIVAGIGEERHGMRQHAVSRLNGDQRYIENRGNGESAIRTLPAHGYGHGDRGDGRDRGHDDDRGHARAPDATPYAFGSRSPAPMLEHFRVGEQRAPDTW